MSEVIAEAAGVPAGRVAALSGPNLAAEVARNLPASAVVAAADLELAERIVARLARRRFRLYVNEDILGVELCGALKNVVAIAAGAADALGLRRQRQGRAADPRPGRDDPARDRRRRQPADVRRAGRDGRPHRDLRLARCRATIGSARSSRRGRSWPEIEATLPGTAEGAYTVDAALALAERLGVEMPIAREVHNAPCSRARASSAAWSTCWPASRRTSWPTTAAGSSGSGARQGSEPRRC